MKPALSVGQMEEVYIRDSITFSNELCVCIGVVCRAQRLPWRCLIVYKTYNTFSQFISIIQTQSTGNTVFSHRSHKQLRYIQHYQFYEDLIKESVHLN